MYELWQALERARNYRWVELSHPLTSYPVFQPPLPPVPAAGAGAILSRPKNRGLRVTQTPIHWEITNTALSPRYLRYSCSGNASKAWAYAWPAK